MPPTIDMDLLTNLVKESDIEYMTNAKQIKNIWEEIAERYCEKKGIPLLPYKTISTRWKNYKFYTKYKARLSGTSVPVHSPFQPLIRKRTEKTFNDSIIDVEPMSEMSTSSFSRRDALDSSNEPPSPSPARTFRPATQKQVSTDAMEKFYKREEHRLRMEEIRLRMTHERELHDLQREKLEVQIAKERVILELHEEQLARLNRDGASHSDQQLVSTIVISKDDLQQEESD